MGILSDAKAMHELTGKPLQDCKRAIKAKNAEVREALKQWPHSDRTRVMAEVCFGEAETTVAAAAKARPKKTQPVAPKGSTKNIVKDSQVQPSKPDSQIQPPPGSVSKSAGEKIEKTLDKPAKSDEKDKSESSKSEKDKSEKKSKRSSE